MKKISADKFFPAVTLLAGIFLTVAAAPLAAKEKEWPPVPPEDLALKDNPAQPGAPAMILIEDIYVDDNDDYEEYYRRLKILTADGLEHANVELFYDDTYTLEGIQGRTVCPDGSVKVFEGKPFDKVVAKRRGVNIRSKSFTLPGAQPGCIIEYRYTRKRDNRYFYRTEWPVQGRLFIRRGKYTLRRYRGPSALTWIFRLPPGKEPREDKDGLLRLELENTPGIPKEAYMPPDDWLRYRVFFFYRQTAVESPEKFWKQEGKEWHTLVEDFIGKRKGVAQAAGQLVATGDDATAKLRKLYERAQQIRNLSYERRKTEQEAKREKLKENNNSEDVLKNGYGYRTEINRLFVALARAAGFPAGVVRIAERDENLFDKGLLEGRQLNGEVAVVTAEGRDLYLDPGTPYCPFGLLAWEKTGVTGIRLGPDGGAFVTTPESKPEQALIERTATLELDEEGTAEGSLEVRYTGQEALELRLEAMDEDEAGRAQMLEKRAKTWVPATAEVKLESASGWEQREEPLQARFRLRLPGLAESTGRRLLVPVMPLESVNWRPFQVGKRENPVYFRHAFQWVDSVKLQAPEGYVVETLPEKKLKDSPLGRYELSSQEEGGRLVTQRTFRMVRHFLPATLYTSLRIFFEAVRQGDELQAVLKVGEGRDAN
jgi:hypothetical protein